MAKTKNWNNMKKITHYTFLMAGVLMLALMPSCSKDFLEVPPQGQLTEEQALIDPNAANQLVTGVYNTLYFGSFGNNTVGFLYAIATEVASDNADKGSTPSDFGPLGEIDEFTMTPNNFIFNNIWSGHYQAITRCNKAIDILQKSSFDEATSNRLQGEVRFLRGFYYFNLVRMFGGVPLLVTVPAATEANNPAFQTRASREEVYAVVTEDLQFAVDNLPLKGEGGAQTGRANKGAAQAMLAKVYLYLQDWQKAYDLSQAVIASGKYDLAEDYATVFREAGANNIESIFEVQTGPGRGSDNCDAVSPNYSNGQGPRARGGWRNVVDGRPYDGDLGFGLNNPSADLANDYAPGDERREGTIIFIQPTTTGGANTGTFLWDGFRIPTQDSVENPRYNYKAYHSPFKETPGCNGYLDKDFKPKNIRIMRYAEVLLINAEAAVQLGRGGEALARLTEVRERAGLAPVPATLQNIWDERRFELAMESDRFFDLVRTGQAASVLRSLGKNFTSGKHEVWPIPQPQIDLSGGLLTQNPGY